MSIFHFSFLSSIIRRRGKRKNLLMHFFSHLALSLVSFFFFSAPQRESKRSHAQDLRGRRAPTLFALRRVSPLNASLTTPLTLCTTTSAIGVYFKFFYQTISTAWRKESEKETRKEKSARTHKRGRIWWNAVRMSGHVYVRECLF